jgi:hypothetical protein
MMSIGVPHEWQRTKRHGGYSGRIHRTIKEEEVDVSEHEDYTAALCELALTFAESGLPRFKSGGQYTGQVREPMAYSELGRR